jgi:hypothetical protein
MNMARLSVDHGNTTAVPISNKRSRLINIAIDQNQELCHRLQLGDGARPRRVVTPRWRLERRETGARFFFFFENLRPELDGMMNKGETAAAAAGWQGRRGRGRTSTTSTRWTWWPISSTSATITRRTQPTPKRLNSSGSGSYPNRMDLIDQYRISVFLENHYSSFDLIVGKWWLWFIHYYMKLTICFIQNKFYFFS